MDRNTRIIDAAYGLTLGAFDDLNGNQDKGFSKWNEPAIQAAATAAAETFVSKLEELNK